MYFSYVIKALNGNSLSNFSLPGDSGYINSTKFYIKESPDDVIFYSDPNSTSIVLEVKKLSTWFRSEDFRYILWFLPVSGYLDVSINDVHVSTTI